MSQDKNVNFNLFGTLKTADIKKRNHFILEQ